MVRIGGMVAAMCLGLAACGGEAKTDTGADMGVQADAAASTGDMATARDSASTRDAADRGTCDDTLPAPTSEQLPRCSAETWNTIQTTCASSGNFLQCVQATMMADTTPAATINGTATNCWACANYVTTQCLSANAECGPRVADWRCCVDSMCGGNADTCTACQSWFGTVNTCGQIYAGTCLNFFEGPVTSCFPVVVDSDAGVATDSGT